LAILCDTNVLLRAVQLPHPQHAAAANSIKHLIRAGLGPVVFLQNIIEFWNVATRPSKYGGLGYSIAETAAEVAELIETVRLIPDDPLTAQIWMRLVTEHQVHDARLVAGMKAHRIREILTFNGRDFARYSGIVVIAPGQYLT
jgi:hypothetical protein